MADLSRPENVRLTASPGIHSDDNWIADYLVPHANVPRTLAVYADVLGRFQWWCKRSGITSFLSFTEEDARRFQVDLTWGKVPSAAAAPTQDDRRPEKERFAALSRATVDHYTGIVQTFFDHLLREGRLTSNPFFRLSKVSRDEDEARRQQKLATLGDVATAALLDTISLWPRHSLRHNARFHQARWAVFVATKCSLTPTQVASASMSAFKLVSDRWCIEVTSAGEATKRVLVEDSVVDAVVEYRSWVRSFEGLAGVTMLPGNGGGPDLPLVGSTRDPRLPVATNRIRKLLREVVDETIDRLRQSGDATIVKSLEPFRIRRTTSEDIAREHAREQRVSSDLVTMAQRFHWVDDCPAGPQYIARESQTSRQLAGNGGELGC